VSPIAAVRGLWRRAVPTPVRLWAQPALSVALETYVRSSARRPHGADGAAGPIKIAGFFGRSHGIAASAKLAARAFEALGTPVERVDLSDAQLNWTGRLTETQSAAAWIFHLNPPELLAALACLGPKRLVGPRYGYWAWELPRAPDRWLKDGALVDEIWAPSRYTAEALAGAAAPVRVVPHPFFLEDYANIAPRPKGAAFQAACLFDFNSSAARKNPQGAIGAFHRAFAAAPDARLVIKTQNGRLFPEVLARLRATAPSNVEIIDEVWPYEAVMGLIAGSDVLISLHRAEGFGLTLAEAMAMGTPVVATAFSGNLDFMDEASALMIPSRPTPVEDPQGIYRGQTWAEPDLDAAARALRRLRDEPGLGAALAGAGRRRVAERLAPKAWFETLPENVQAAARRAAGL
jgi:glycosyltransferase involved in cell wall biosynthesis